MTPFRCLVCLLLAGLAAACAADRTRIVRPSPSRPAVAAPSPAPGTPAAVPPTTQDPVSRVPAPAVSTAQAPPTLAPGPTAPRTPAPTPSRGRQIVLNFDNADIEAVIQAASEIAGFNYTLGPGVAGKKVTVQTAGRIPEEEVLNVLLAVLEVNGVTAIRSGNLYKIVPIAAARERPVPTIIGAQSDPTRRDDEVITQIVPIVHVPAERVAAAIRPFVQGGNLVAHGNLLILTDTAGNIRRLLQIVAVLDVEVALDELRMIPVRYADAVELARTFNDFFGGRRVRTPVAPTPAPAVPPRPGVPAVPGVSAPAEPVERPPLILADKRTNVLVVSARRADLELISQLVSQLDIDTQANKRVFVYYVENVKAKELAATLTEIFGKPGEGAARPERPTPAEAPGYAPGPPRVAPPAPPASAPPTPPVPGVGPEAEAGVVEGQVKVIADEPNNALIVTTFPRNWPLIEDTIRKLDRTPKQVLIEVLVAEIELDDDNRLGIEWTLRTQQSVKLGGQTYNVGSVSRVDGGGTLAPPPGQGATLPPTFPVGVPPFAGLSFFIFETDRFLGLINLYANYNRVNVLSSPHILTSENKKAIINVSDSIPIVTGQTVSQTGTVQGEVQQPPSNVLNQTVEYRDAGIILTVTPRISDKRVVALDVKQTVNDVGAPQPPSGSPIIRKREAETSVVLHDNQTLVLGGLIQTRRADGQTGIPGLSRIPIVGFLFGATRKEFRRSELLILITPRVIGDPTEARDVYEQIRGQRPDLQRSLRTHPSILKPEKPETNPSAERTREPPPASVPPDPGGPGER